MAEKKCIKVKFCDGYGIQQNYIRSILDKHYILEDCENPEFVFFSVFGNEHIKYQNATKIFYTGECCTPDFRQCDFALGYDYIQYENRYLRMPYLNAFNSNMNDREWINEKEALNRKFCNFVYSNGNRGRGTQLRKKFCIQLMKYKNVDCPGKVLHNLDDPMSGQNEDYEMSKIKFLRNYKFTIAFENCKFPGYTTEKLIDAFVAGSVPIYWGNPLVIRDFNPASFINASEYEFDLDKIIDKVKELDSDDDKYMKMLKQPPMQNDFDYAKTLKDTEKFIVNIIEGEYQVYERDPMGFMNNMALSSFTNREINYELIRRSTPGCIKNFLKKIQNKR